MGRPEPAGQDPIRQEPAPDPIPQDCATARPRTLFIRCIRQRAEQSDQLLDTARAGAISAIIGGAAANPNARRYWLRTLMEAQQQWQAWRDLECQRLAVLEASRDSTFAAQMLCRITMNRQRAADLNARYAAPAATLSARPELHPDAGDESKP